MKHEAFLTGLEPEHREATFSACRRYRYALKIIWDRDRLPVQFIGLNPSTADEFKDDPTVRKCKNFAKRDGWGGIMMTNLFAFRDTDPKRMMVAPINPIGEIDNDGVQINDIKIMAASLGCALTIACWGNDGAFKNRSAHVAGMILGMKCFGVTMKGHPRHPLYLPNNVQLEDL